MAQTTFSPWRTCQETNCRYCRHGKACSYKWRLRAVAERQQEIPSCPHYRPDLGFAEPKPETEPLPFFALFDPDDRPQQLTLPS